MDRPALTALRMERQHLVRKANETEYISLYRDSQPGQNVYWNGFGNPPSLTYRAAFNDIEFNRERQANRTLIKGRFAGGNLGWIMPEDLELFAALYVKPLPGLMPRQYALMELIEREGPLTIQQMKEEMKMLVKEITPVLHRLQEAFLVYEDQYDGEWDRGWYKFSDMFPDVDLGKYSRHDALKMILRRFAYRHVCFDVKMAKSFYKLPEKDIKAAVEALAAEGILIETDGGYMLRRDFEMMEQESFRGADNPGEHACVFALHRNDFLVKSNAFWLKEKYNHPEFDVLYYVLADGEFCGAVVGRFRNGPFDLEDVVLDLPEDEAAARKDEVLRAVRIICGKGNKIKRYLGVEV